MLLATLAPSALASDDGHSGDGGSSAGDGGDATAAATTGQRRPRQRRSWKEPPVMGSRKSDRPTKKRTFLTEFVDTTGKEFAQQLAIADKPPVPKLKPESDAPITSPGAPLVAVGGAPAGGASASESDDDEDVDVGTGPRKRHKGTKATVPAATTGPSGTSSGASSAKKKQATTTKDTRPTAISLHDIHVGDTLAHTVYMHVTDVNPTGNYFEYRVLRGTKEGDDWRVNTCHPYIAVSSSLVRDTVKCSKTKLAEVLMSVKDEVFTVKFRPVLTVDSLADRLHDLGGYSGPGNNSISTEDMGDCKNAATELMTGGPIRTIVGRMIKPNTTLGYSLVDDLESAGTNDTQTRVTRFKKINHRDILEIIYRGTRYVLKK